MKEFIEKLIGRLEDYKTKAYVTGFTNSPYEFGACSGMDSAIKIVKELAEESGKDTNVTSKDGWIPCSERLPEEYGEYLTYVDYADETFIAIDEFDCEGILKEWNVTPNYHILAWQPLPEPYREEFD